MPAGFKPHDLAQFDAAVKRWFDAAEAQAAQAAVGLARRGFEKLLASSPQYSGDFAAGWGVGYGRIVTNFKSDRFPREDEPLPLMPYQRGSPVAMAAARDAAVWKPLKLGTSIYLSNNARHGDEDYAILIERGEIVFRPENAHSDRVMRKAHQFLAHRYRVLGKSQLEALKGIGV